MQALRITSLISGGLITNYYCTSTCRHCLYNCSPKWPKNYISRDTALELFNFCKRNNCYSLHIGGGEPFLNRKGLLDVAMASHEIGIHIEYIETNSSWYVNEHQACNMLDRLLSLGITTLLVSISPFHLEFIPLRKVYGVINACKKTGMKIFPWTSDFLYEFSRLDPDKTYSFSELKEIFGEGYIKNIPQRYWIHPGGRALNYFFHGNMSLNELLETYSSGCKELSDTTHFHFDLYGNFIPGLCAGLSLKKDDLFNDISSKKYPILSILFAEGIKGLFEFAKNYGYKPSNNKKYGSKCSLCFEIRRFFVKNVKSFPELRPVFYYYQ